MPHSSQIYTTAVEANTLQNSKARNSISTWLNFHLRPMSTAAPVHPCWQMGWAQDVGELFSKEDGFYKLHRYLKSCLEQLHFLLSYFLITFPIRKILSLYRTMYDGQEAIKEYPFLKVPHNHHSSRWHLRNIWKDTLTCTIYRKTRAKI